MILINVIIFLVNKTKQKMNNAYYNHNIETDFKFKNKSNDGSIIYKKKNYIIIYNNNSI